MSSALALAGVTAVLRDLLNDGIVTHNVSGVIGSTVVVSAVPPDRVVGTSGTGETPQINLFLHHVTPTVGWRNEALPSRDSGGNRLTNPPLALDLHYLVSVYATGDLHGEILLGSAMQLLHETPVLTREVIRNALSSQTLLPALGESGLDRQIEQIRIVPEQLNTEELSKLWTATLSNYRPTAAYQVSVVLIESSRPARSPLPVLSRGKIDPVTQRDAGVEVHANLLPAYPWIGSIAPDTGQAAAEIGDTLTVSGQNLDGVATKYRLLLSNARLGIDRELKEEVGGSGTAVSVQFELTDGPPSLPAGSYTASLQLSKPDEDKPRVTNSLAVLIAPRITAGIPATAPLGPNGSLTLTPICAPEVRPEQRVSLLLDGYEVPAGIFTTATATPTFTFERLPPGKYWVRLRVDGIDSLLVRQTAGELPRFTGPQIEVTG